MAACEGEVEQIARYGGVSSSCLRTDAEVPGNSEENTYDATLRPRNLEVTDPPANSIAPTPASSMTG
jgi:hypothetical protein